MCFFFYARDTTYIDTYSHPLALHQAVPISRDLPAARDALEQRRPHAQQPAGAEGHQIMEVLRSVVEQRVRLLMPGKRRIECEHPEHRHDQQPPTRSEEHTSELQSLMRISYAVFCLKKNNQYH